MLGRLIPLLEGAFVVAAARPQGPAPAVVRRVPVRGAPMALPPAGQGTRTPEIRA